MKAWNIFSVKNGVVGNSYSIYYASVRADNEKNRTTVVKEWKDRMHFSSGPNCLPDCEWTARPYVETRLDSYGVKRNG